MANRKAALAVVAVGAAGLALWALTRKGQAGGGGLGIVLRVIDLQTGREVGTVGGASALAVYYGDGNRDGVVDAGDLAGAELVLQDILAGRPVDPDVLKRVDVNGDGQVTQADIDLIAQYVLGMITQFPVEAQALAFMEGGAYQVQAAVSNKSMRNGQPVGVTLDIEIWGETLFGVETDFLPRASMEVAFAASQGKVVTRDFTIPMGRAGSDGRIHARLFPGPDTAPYDPTRLLGAAFRAFAIGSVPILRDVTLESIRFTRQSDSVDAPLVGAAYQVSEGSRYTMAMQLLPTKTQGGVGLPVDIYPVLDIRFSSGERSGSVLSSANVPSGTVAQFSQTIIVPTGAPNRTGTVAIQVQLDGQTAKTFTVPLAVVAAPIEYGGIITLSRPHRG
jgi:hypothetical protein